MSKYRIGQPDLNGKVWIEDTEEGKVFNGYDFMGSVDWVDYGGDAYWAEPDEAEQIIADLEDADGINNCETEEAPMVEIYLKDDQGKALYRVGIADHDEGVLEILQYLIDGMGTLDKVALGYNGNWYSGSSVGKRYGLRKRTSDERMNRFETWRAAYNNKMMG